MGILCAAYTGIAFYSPLARQQNSKIHYVEVTSTKFPCLHMLKPFGMNISQVTLRKKFGAKRGEGTLFYSPNLLCLKVWIVEQ